MVDHRNEGYQEDLVDQGDKGDQKVEGRGVLRERG
jgi:hypothetical protein